MKKFFAKIRRTLFGWRVNREIFNKIFPHLNKETDSGYPFQSDEELEKQMVFNKLNAHLHLDMIERRAARMPKAYGEAFRYIAYRDLDSRMKIYLELAEERIQPETCDPRFVAKAA